MSVVVLWHTAAPATCMPDFRYVVYVYAVSGTWFCCQPELLSSARSSTRQLLIRMRDSPDSMWTPTVYPRQSGVAEHHAHTSASGHVM